MSATMHDPGGVHCETTTLGVLLRYGGVDLTEAMRFGLGAGLGFIYWDSKRQELPFLGGRVKPFQLTENLTARLGLQLVVNETTSAKRAFDTVVETVEQGVPVGLQLDSYYLDYFSPQVHFAGHFVAMYDRDEHQAFLVETAQQGGLVAVGYESLARARGARGPMSARHRSFTVEGATATTGVTRDHLIDAITSCAAAFVDPPIANLGHRGIHTTAKRIPTWWDRMADPSQGLPEIAFMMEQAGTGGALFRNLYRDFLAQSLVFFDGHSGAKTVSDAVALFASSARLWTEVAGMIEQAGMSGDRGLLNQAGLRLEEIHRLETDAMANLGTLR